jgi:HK97 family phage prohead protease
MNEYVKRNYPAEFRAEGEGGLIVGTPIVFDTPTDIGGFFQETIVKGAITPDVLRSVDFYFNHDLNSKKIARSIIPLDKLGGMEFEITESGVNMRANVNRKRSDANDLYLAIEDGTIDGMSFMFRVAEERWEDKDTDYPKRFITRIDPIIEVSAVNYPAYKSTSINVSRGDLSSENDKVALEKMRAEERAKADNLANEKRELELLKLKSKYLY